MIETHIENDVAYLTLNAPPVNVIDRNMMSSIQSFLSQIGNRREIRFLVLKSAIPDRFSAGVSVPEHEPEQAPEMIRTFHETLLQWARMPQITLAEVTGFAYGGAAEWLLLTDLVVAHPETRIGFPEIKLAFFPPVALAFLPSVVGYARALERILTGAEATARDWHAWGWHLCLAQDEPPENTLQRILKDLRGYSAAVLDLVHRTYKGLYLDAALRRLDHAEKVFIEQLLQLEDPAEGVRAFMEKRTPQWKHR